MLDVDVLIIGGGLVGSSLAAALASHPLAKGLSVMIVDPHPPSVHKWPALSLRTSTITPSSKNFLEEIGVWTHIPPTRIAPFDKMFVWDHPAPLPRASPGGDLSKVPAGTLYFDAADVQEDVLGYVVDNDTLRNALYRCMEELADQRGRSLRFAKGMVYAINYGNGEEGSMPDKSDGGVAQSESLTGGENSVPWPIVELDDGQKIRCRLIAACDGSRSRVRTLAGADWFSHGYDQSAVVANVTLRDPIRTAYQRFVATGPVAVLPVCTDDTAAPVGNVIWTTTKVEAEALAVADDSVFLNELNIVLSADEENGTELADDSETEVLGAVARKPRPDDLPLWNLLARGLQVALPGMGLADERITDTDVVQPPDCLGVLGKRGKFPLVLGHAPRYVIEEKRTVLVGDAAHSIHPLAGQGVNLGFSDVQALADCLASAAATGRDVGGERGAPLMRFQRERLVGNMGMIGVLHSLQRIFSRDSPKGFRELRRVGMSAVNAVGPMKRLILRAMR